MVNIFWFRRDLRLEDNHGLYQAIQAGLPVLPLFIFDTDILEELEDKDDARVTFIWQATHRVHQALQKQGSGLEVHIGTPLTGFKKILTKYKVHTVYANRDYEPAARKREEALYNFFQSQGIAFKAFKDHVMWEKNEVVKSDGQPYTVFTPYARAWKQKLGASVIPYYPSMPHATHLHPVNSDYFPSLSEIGFQKSGIKIPKPDVDDEIIKKYHQTRDYPYLLSGTSRIGVHLRFGTISIRQLVNKARRMNEVYLNELIWREFYMMIIWHFPQVVQSAFKPAYDHIVWHDDPAGFQAWCAGMTGYPLVDAGMRELNATGYMHNRLRMVTASFLTKHLLIDWRLGEAYFARKLLDFELSSNNGGWQWAAGTGCDAAPYFRIFNPALQAKKFDPEQQYQLRWIPELNTSDYPPPIVDHSLARDRAIQIYREALKTR